MSKDTGLSRLNAKLLAGTAHIEQSIVDILTTPVGSRVMRRQYGSLIPELLDRPISETLICQLYAATAVALMTYEPRIQLIHLAAENITGNGSCSVCITYQMNGSDRRYQFNLNLASVR